MARAVAVIEAEIVDFDEEQSRAKAKDDLRQAILAFVGRLQSVADRRVTQRTDIEQRWIEDLRQFHGKYDHDTLARLKEDDTKSRVFVNKTRQKTNAMAAKIFDMLFPTDDRNWGIQPSPVPEMVIENERRQAAASEADAEYRDAAMQAGSGTPQQDLGLSPKLAAMRMEAERLQALADELQGEMEAARLKSDMMQAEIDDRLKGCAYAAKCRDAIDWACKIGSGIMRGPVVNAKPQPKWAQKMAPGKGPTAEPQMQWALEPRADKYPSFSVVDPWSYFPDMEAGNNVADGEGDLVRHLMNKKMLRALARREGFEAKAIEKLLTGVPDRPSPSYLNDLRDITGDQSTVDSNLYQVWEYIGPITAEDLRDTALWYGDMEMMQEAERMSPLEEVNAVVWFCQGELLFFGPHPLDSGECLFSVFSIEKDETCPFGYGIPYMLRDPQRAMNGAWRLILENAAISAAPQVVINTDIVEPIAGDDWKLRGKKLWRLKQNIPANHRAFDIFHIPSVQGELENIIRLAVQFIDDESGISQIAEGQQGADVTKTSSGMAMLMNSTNVILRRVARNFDDDVTVPNIRRMYHFEMQHSKKEHIKGDYEVDARGSSVLLVRELQQQNLMLIASTFGAHPVYGKMLKNADLMRQIVASMMIPADTLVPTDAEIKAAELAEQEAMAAAEQAGATPGPDPELEERRIALEEEKIELQRELANQRADLDWKVAKLRYDSEMDRTAQDINQKLEALEAKSEDSEREQQHKERIFAGEAAVTMRRPPSAPTGGGNL